VVPYHMWIPDVYDGAPTAFTLLVGTAPKLAAFALTLRLLSGALQGTAIDWQGMLVVLSLLSMVIGNVIAIAQTSIKRMLAYSTIANMGFMLLGFLTANRYGFSAAMFYTVTYVLTSLASFGIVMLLSRDGFESDQLDDLKGLNQRSPWWAFIMLLVMFSLAGLPPTVGFYGKFMVIEAAVNDGFVWLAVVGVLASLIGALLPAHRQADVLRRSRTDRADHRPRRHERAAFRERIAATGAGHRAATVDRALRHRADAIELPLTDFRAALSLREPRANIDRSICGPSCALGSLSPAWSI
jgi:formate hydrogenlyase subunit 3/multisubunit Na+/H+ antiporter MnhD subunit